MTYSYKDMLPLRYRGFTPPPMAPLGRVIDASRPATRERDAVRRGGVR